MPAFSLPYAPALLTVCLRRGMERSSTAPEGNKLLVADGNKLPVVSCQLPVKTKTNPCISLATNNWQLATYSVQQLTTYSPPELAASVYNLFPIIYGATLLDQ